MIKNAPTHPTVRVLLVEDNAIAIFIAQSLLIDAGCVVDVAKTGVQAIEKFHNTYHLILLDMGLPDYDGLDIAQLIRHHPGAIASVPIVALTAHANDITYHERAKKIGLNGFFSKPFSPKLCAALVTGIVEGNTDFWQVQDKC